MLGALFVDYGSAAHGKVAASGMRLGFKHAASKSGTGQLVSRGQTGNACSEDQHGFIVPGACG